jgi:hypothetical protein
MNIKAVLVIVFAFATSNAMAASEKPISIDVSKPDFAAQKELVLNAIEKNEHYSEISAEDREKIKQGLSKLSGKLATDAGFAALTQQEQEQALSQQTLINQLLVKAAKDSQIICRDDGETGTHLPNKVCRTRAGHKLYAKQQREAMERNTNGSDLINSKVSDDMSGN